MSPGLLKLYVLTTVFGDHRVPFLFYFPLPSSCEYQTIDIIAFLSRKKMMRKAALLSFIKDTNMAHKVLHKRILFVLLNY